MLCSLGVIHTDKSARKHVNRAGQVFPCGLLPMYTTDFPLGICRFLRHFHTTGVRFYQIRGDLLGLLNS